MRHERDRAVVLVGRHLDGRRAEVEREPFDECEIGCRGLLVAAHDPGAAHEDVGARRDGPAAFAAGHRMRADVVREVDAASAQFAERIELHARDIGDDGIRERGQFALDDVGDDVRRDGDDHEQRAVTVGGRATRAVVDGEPQLRGRRVGERDVDADRAQRMADAGTEQPGTDDPDRAGGASRTRACIGNGLFGHCSSASAVPGRRGRRRARHGEQRAAFHCSQLAGPPRREGSQVQRPELTPHEVDDGVAHGRHHAPDDAVAPGVQRELDQRGAAGGVKQARLVGLRWVRPPGRRPSSAARSSGLSRDR